jgi:hypothetical protein
MLLFDGFVNRIQLGALFAVVAAAEHGGDVHPGGETRRKVRADARQGEMHAEGHLPFYRVDAEHAEGHFDLLRWVRQGAKRENHNAWGLEGSARFNFYSCRSLHERAPQDLTVNGRARSTRKAIHLPCEALPSARKGVDTHSDRRSRPRALPDMNRNAPPCARGPFDRDFIRWLCDPSPIHMTLFAPSRT